MEIRQPIVTLVGHVDHGKTTILDSIRSTAIAAKEAGGITQIISFTAFPAKIIEEKCKQLLELYKIKLTIPGFLFIDTPGHAAFINLRKRGGALADLAILVVDINEGIMPQSVESIEILKANKIPFIVALNKIDALSGWQKRSGGIEQNIVEQADYVKKSFEEKLYRIVGSLSNYGFDSDVFYRISDFKKQLALVPCSGKTGEGVPELLVMLSGLSQKFLTGKLTLHKETKGTVLEVKRKRDILYLESIVYDGLLALNDTLVIAGLEKPIVTKVKALSEALPLARGFKAAKKVKAAVGIRLQVPKATEVLPGMPFIAVKEVKGKKAEIEKAAKAIQKEVTDIIKVDKEGVIIKADSLGSLEALLMLLRKQNIPISKVGIGSINKADVVAASASLTEKPLDAVVLGFDVALSEDVKEEKKVKLLVNDVIYRLIEDFTNWRKEKQLALEREKLAGIIMPCKIKILPYIFRQSRPAIFGVSIEAGILVPGTRLMNIKGKTIDKVKAIQSEGKTIEKVGKDKEVAISLPETNFARKLRKGETLYSDISERDFRKLKENKKLLTADEISLLQEIVRIKRKEKATWGF